MLSDGLHTYEFLSEQLQKVKTLKRLVKHHDLQLRDCINHSEPNVVDVFARLDLDSDAKQAAQIEEEAQKIIESLELNVDTICGEVEKQRAEIEQQSQHTIIFINTKLQQIVRALIELYNLNEEVDKIIEIQQQQEVERSKEAFSTDDTFKALLDEKQALASEESALRAQIKELDNSEITQLQDLSKTLKSEKIQLEQEFHTICSEKHEALAQNQHLDEVAAEMLEEFMNSTMPLGKKMDATQQYNEDSQESGVWNIAFKEPQMVLANLFQADAKTLFKDYQCTPMELEMIQTVIEQRKRERKVISDIATALAELKDPQEHKVHPLLQKMLVSNSLLNTGHKTNLPDFDLDLFKEKPSTEAIPEINIVEEPPVVTEAYPRPTSKKLPPHMNLLQDI